MMQCGRERRSFLPKRIGLVARAGALALIALTSLMPGIARAEDDEDGIWNLDKKLFNWMFSGLGPRHHADDPYVYRERPPLVVPTNRAALPPPTSLEASRPANWPVDPEIKRSQEAAAAKRAKGRQADDFEYDPLPPSALAAPAGAARSSTPNPSAGGGDMTDTLRPSQLGSSSGIFGFLTGATGTNAQPDSQDRQDAAISEPPPKSLTDPPRGYQTPSPNQPYGAGAPRYGKPTKAADLPVGTDQGL
jgi:hypothetical protein